MKTDELFHRLDDHGLRPEDVKMVALPSADLLKRLRNACVEDEAALQEIQLQIDGGAEDATPLQVLAPEMRRRHGEAVALLATLTELQERGEALAQALNVFRKRLQYLGGHEECLSKKTGLTEFEQLCGVQMWDYKVPVDPPTTRVVPDFNDIYMSKLSPELRKRACLNTRTGLVEIRLQDLTEIELELPLPESPAEAPRKPPFVLRYDSDGNDP